MGLRRPGQLCIKPLLMAPKMESMYEYDPVRKQYRRRGGEATPESTAPPSSVPKGAGDIYDTRSGRGRSSLWGAGRSTAPSRPTPGMGKRVFWIIFTIIAVGWATMTLVLSRQHRRSGEPFSLRSLFVDIKPPPMLPVADP